MNALDAANYFAVIVGLICNWKSERGDESGDKFDDFLNYLLIHHFETLRGEILESRDLQVHLKGLLSGDLSSISGKLDVISQGMAALAEKMDALGPLVQSLGTSGEGLSEQAAQILKVFDQSDAEEMIWMFEGAEFMFLPSQMSLSFSEKRYVRADLESLLGLGFLKMADSPDPDARRFVLTRLGSRYAGNLPKVSIGGLDS